MIYRRPKKKLIYCIFVAIFGRSDNLSFGVEANEAREN